MIMNDHKGNFKGHCSNKSEHLNEL